VTDNPYQAPAVQEVVAPAATEAEAIRGEHLKHEASLKGVGFLYLLGGVMLAFSFIGLFGVMIPHSTGSSRALGLQELVIFALLGVVGVGQFFAGWGLRKLRPWAKIPAALLAGISLLSIPIGTLIGAYILYLLFSAKGRTILSPAYSEIVAQTPHMRYRTSRWVWITLLVVLLVIIAGFVALYVQSRY
jgi:hypothetical protein